MPKGVKRGRGALDAVAQEVVPPNAKAFPGTCTPENPDGIPLPEGIRVRSGTGVEVRFELQGERICETLKGRPTVTFVRQAAEKRSRVIQLIALGKFDGETYAQEFPASRRVAAARKAASARQRLAAPVYTVGMAMDDWLVTAWDGLSINTRKDYVRSIRAQIKPLHVAELDLPDEAFVLGAHSGAQPKTVTLDGNAAPVDGMGPSASTSTLPMRFVIKDVPLADGEQPSTRRRRLMRRFKEAGSGGLPPTRSRTVRAYEPEVLPLRCLAQLRVDAITDVEAAAIRSAIVASVPSIKRAKNIVGPLNQAFERLVRTNRLALNPFALLPRLDESGLPAPAAPRERAGSAPDSPGDLDDDWLDADDGEDKAFGHLDGDNEGPDPLNPDEIKSLLNHIDPAVRNQVIFAIFSGLRTGEHLALRSSDIDWERRKVNVRRSLSRGELKRPKTGKSRVVDLLPPAYEALKAQIELLGAPDGWVFPNPATGRRWANESKFSRRWRNALQAADVRYRRSRQTRHTYASMMLSAGENLLYVAGQLGHQDWRMVQERYARWTPKHSSRQAGSACAEAHAQLWQSISQQGGSPPESSDLESSAA